MSPIERREAIIEAALAVALRKGLAATTVRDVALEMGTSPGLVHHYFDSMDALLATAFERAAVEGYEATRKAMAASDDPIDELRQFFASYIRADEDWAFQLWLDAWSEAARRPVLRATSQRLNVAWQQLLVEVIERGVRSGDFRCPDPEAAGWRILSLLDGLALQAVAHRISFDRAAVVRWSVSHAESELGLPPGTLTPTGAPPAG